MKLHHPGKPVEPVNPSDPMEPLNPAAESKLEQNTNQNNLDSEKEKSSETPDELEKIKAINEDTKVKNEEEDKELESLLYKLDHFQPKRPQVPQPRFPDLNLEGEMDLRQKCNGHGNNFWRMPFRQQMFSQEIK